jgi:hypothetical protein
MPVTGGALRYAASGAWARRSLAPHLTRAPTAESPDTCADRCPHCRCAPWAALVHAAVMHTQQRGFPCSGHLAADNEPGHQGRVLKSLRMGPRERARMLSASAARSSRRRRCTQTTARPYCGGASPSTKRSQRQRASTSSIRSSTATRSPRSNRAIPSAATVWHSRSHCARDDHHQPTAALVKSPRSARLRKIMATAPDCVFGGPGTHPPRSSRVRPSSHGTRYAHRLATWRGD